MDKTKTVVIVILLSMLILGGSYFGILVKEQNKRVDSRGALSVDIQTSLAEAERRRQEYFADVDAKKADLKKAMDESRAKYEALLQQQPALIEANKKTVSVPVTKTVTEKVPVTTSTPTSTRKTKTS